MKKLISVLLAVICLLSSTTAFAANKSTYTTMNYNQKYVLVEESKHSDNRYLEMNIKPTFTGGHSITLDINCKSEYSVDVQEVSENGKMIFFCASDVNEKHTYRKHGFYLEKGKEYNIVIEFIVREPHVENRSTIILQKCDHPMCVEEIKQATTNTNGSVVTFCTICGCRTEKTLASIKKAAVGSSKYIYTGKSIKPTVKAYDANNKIIPDTNYKVKYGKKTGSVGTHKITVVFKGKLYKGSVTCKYKVVPKKPNITSLDNKNNTATVRISNGKNSCTGVQLMYSPLSNFKKGVTLNKKGKNVVFKFKGVYGTYYYKARTYKVVKGKRYYSSWSKVKHG